LSFFYLVRFFLTGRLGLGLVAAGFAGDAATAGAAFK
jgi:hypothetical protein